MDFEPTSFATDIIECPSMKASCESISQHPMWPETVTAGLLAARNSAQALDISPDSMARGTAFLHVQKACPTERAIVL